MPMPHSNEQLTAAEDADLRQRVANVELALRGDFKNPGLLHQFLNVMTDLYDQRKGLQPRVEAIEEWQIRKDSFVAGAGWVSHVVASVGGGGLVWLLSRIFH